MMKDRILQIRRILGLTQKEFGLNLGCSRDKIANIELGRVVPDDVFIRHICVVYKVNELWMKTGEGEIWEKSSDSVRHKFEAYENAPSNVKCLIDSILSMPDEEQKNLDAFLTKLAALIQERSGQ